MPTRRWWQQAIFILTLLLASCSGEDPVPRLPKLAANATILAFGDSLTHGTGVAAPQSYPTQLSERIGRTVINAGIPGETTAEGRVRLAAVLDEHRPQLVILCLGGNDFLRKHDKAQTRANLDAMLREIKSRFIPVVLLGVPEPKLLGLKTDPLYDELAQVHGLPVERRVIAEVLSDPQRKSDTIHPNADGYRDIAVAIAALLKKAGAV